MPAERGALDPDGKRAHAPEDFEFLGKGGRAPLPRPLIPDPCHNLVKSFEQLSRLRHRLPLHRLRHHRGARLGYRTALALEGRLGDDVAIQPEPHLVQVAAERVPSLRVSVGVLEQPEVPRRPIVVEDEALVELVELAPASVFALRSSLGHWKTLRASSSPSTRASISPAVL